MAEKAETPSPPSAERNVGSSFALLLLLLLFRGTGIRDEARKT